MDFQQILNHARRGVHQTPTLPGLRHPSIKGSLEFATTDIDTLKKWNSNGYAGHSFGVSVAKNGATCILDIDGPEQAQRLDIPNYDDTFVVNSPTPRETSRFTTCTRLRPRNWAIVMSLVPTASPSLSSRHTISPVLRRCEAPRQGTLRRVRSANDLPIKPIPQEMVNWLKKNSSKKESSSRHINKSDFHPSFDRDDWIDHYELSATGAEKTVAGVGTSNFPAARSWVALMKVSTGGASSAASLSGTASGSSAWLGGETRTLTTSRRSCQNSMTSRTTHI